MKQIFKVEPVSRCYTRGRETRDLRGEAKPLQSVHDPA